MKRLVLVFLFSFGVLAVLDFLNPIEKTKGFLASREIEIIGDDQESKPVKVFPFENVLQKIEEGKRLLSDSALLKIEERGTRKKEIALAVLDTQTGDVVEARYWIEEREMDKANKVRTQTCGKEDHYPYFDPVEDDQKFHVLVNRWNGHNSNLAIVTVDCQDQDRYIVVANKILIPNKYLVYPEERKGKNYSSIIYVPYSEQLHREEIVREGLEFLNESTELAFKQLEELEIRSKAEPERTVADVISRVFVKNIFINEQSDPKSMILSDDGGRRVAERALTRLGMNKERAFRYTYSPVGALGLGQIMPTTYKNIVRNYPEADLIKDIGIGRVDIINSIKASVLVLDDHFAVVVKNAGKSSRSRALLSQKSKEEVEDIMAAIYNGGPGKYQPLIGSISLAVSETVSFLMKLDLIRNLKLFD